MMDTALQLRSRYLLEPTFWRPRLERLRSTRRSLIFTPRPDLSSLLVEVDEWRLRAHDGERLWGLRARSSFHPDPFGATVRLVTAPARPEIDVAVVAEGQVEWVLQVAPGRRLEDRVLDLVRLRGREEDHRLVNHLMLLVQPAHLQRIAQRELDQDQRRTVRAEMIRTRLGK